MHPLRQTIALLPFLVALSGCEDPLGGNDAPADEEIAAPSPGPPGLRPGYITLVNDAPDASAVMRFDVGGNSLDAHDGEIERFGDLYYLYGVGYGCGFYWKVPGTPYCGIRVYSSPDLVEWTYRGAAFDASTAEWQSRCDGRTTGCFRPHVAYNARTGKYVLWLNTYDVPGGYRVFTADRPEGPFLEQEPARVANSDRPFDPRGNRFNGDHNLFVDEDGSGYVVYTDWRRGGDIVVERLTSDYLNGTGEHVRLGLRYMEAPTLFRRGNRYYLIISDPACPYCETGTSYFVAPAPLGPWSGKKKITETSCGGQPTHVSPLPARDGGTVYLYQSDRWDAAFPNEAVAPQYWAPLEFTAGGEIAPLACTRFSQVPIAVAGRAPNYATANPEIRLQDDIGAWGGTVEREVRFTATRTGRLREIALPIYKKTWPMNRPAAEERLAPLTIELFRDTTSVYRATIGADQVTHSARRYALKTDVALEAGQPYRLRLSAFSASHEPDRYGFAYFVDATPREGYETFYLRDARGWLREPHLTLVFSLRISGG